MASEGSAQRGPAHAAQVSPRAHLEDQPSAPRHVASHANGGFEAVARLYPVRTVGGRGIASFLGPKENRSTAFWRGGLQSPGTRARRRGRGRLADDSQAVEAHGNVSVLVRLCESDNHPEHAGHRVVKVVVVPFSKREPVRYCAIEPTVRGMSIILRAIQRRFRGVSGAASTMWPNGGWAA